MLDLLNEVLAIEDNEPEFVQMGISGKSGAKMKAPDGGKAGMKGDFNAMHPRYPKGHPQGGKFMPKGSKDQIKAIAKNTGQSVEKVAAAVGGKAPANKGKLGGKFMGSAGAVGKAQKVLKNKDSTPEQRAKAKASIKKAADQGRNVYGSIKGSPAAEKRLKKERQKRFLKALDDRDKSAAKAAKTAAKSAVREAKASAKKTAQLRQSRSKRKNKLIGKAINKGTGNRIVSNVIKSSIARDPKINNIRTISGDKAIAKSIARNAKKKAKR